MNARLLSITMLAAALGAATVTFAPSFSAPVPEPRPQRWEYKVVSVSSAARGETSPADVLTEQLNTLAKDGWEYNGPVVSESGRGVIGRQYVVFRRFKS